MRGGASFFIDLKIMPWYYLFMGNQLYLFSIHQKVKDTSNLTGFVVNRGIKYEAFAGNIYYIVAFDNGLLGHRKEHDLAEDK
ncbi:MAG: hypothetical protein KAV87_65010 [Desulfobacteraceae bacterium]|nr:hypothetical protein [Desulfobacteraceae bacterium]